jgi:hypothetical protein
MPLMRALLSVSLSVLLSGFAQGQEQSESSYLMRMERQTREEDVCMLVEQSGRFHLERVAAGRARVYEGSLDSSVLNDLRPLLNSEQIVSLQQSQIETALASEEMDQILLAIARPSGWQSLNFSSAKSRKPYRASLDPLIKWLDRNKQQQNPITGMGPSRCMPPQAAQQAGYKRNTSNPFMMRIVVDHYEPANAGPAGSADTNSRSGGGGSLNSQTGLNSTANLKITRLCAIVYESGRYRLEKTVQEFGSQIRSDVYRDTVDNTQLDELRKLLDNPKLAALPSSAAASVSGREGELISLVVPRENQLQSLSFASFFGARTAEAGMKDNTSTAVSANVELTHPIRHWVKQILEEHKVPAEKESASTTCIPSAQPE